MSFETRKRQLTTKVPTIEWITEDEWIEMSGGVRVVMGAEGDGCVFFDSGQQYIGVHVISSPTMISHFGCTDAIILFHSTSYIILQPHTSLSDQELRGLNDEECPECEICNEEGIFMIYCAQCNQSVCETCHKQVNDVCPFCRYVCPYTYNE